MRQTHRCPTPAPPPSPKPAPTTAVTVAPTPARPCSGAERCRSCSEIRRGNCAPRRPRTAPAAQGRRRACSAPYRQNSPRRGCSAPPPPAPARRHRQHRTELAEGEHTGSAAPDQHRERPGKKRSLCVPIIHRWDIARQCRTPGRQIESLVCIWRPVPDQMTQQRRNGKRHQQRNQPRADRPAWRGPSTASDWVPCIVTGRDRATRGRGKCTTAGRRNRPKESRVTAYRAPRSDSVSQRAGADKCCGASGATSAVVGRMPRGFLVGAGLRARRAVSRAAVRSVRVSDRRSLEAAPGWSHGRPPARRGSPQD